MRARHGQDKVLKMMGSIVVPGNHVVRIGSDRKFQAIFDESRKRRLDPPKQQEQSTQE